MMQKLKSNKLAHVHSDKENMPLMLNSSNYTRINTMPINAKKDFAGNIIDNEQRLNNYIESKIHNKKNTLKIDMLVYNDNDEMNYKPKTYNTMITREAQRKINSPFISSNTKNRMNEIVSMQSEREERKDK